MKNFQQYLQEKLILINNGAKYGQIVILAGGSACFDKDTPIKTKDGNKFISDITTGDLVQSLDIESNTLEHQQVTDTHANKLGDKKLVEVYFDDGTSVVCTEDHEFWDEETKTWIEAKNLIF